MQRSDLETAAARYTYLRGLFFIPFGMLLVLAALDNWSAGPFRSAWAFPAAVLATGAVCLAVARYYDDHYGRLSPSARQQARAAFALAATVAVMAGGSLLLRSRADWSLDLPVNPIAVCFALVMLISYGIGVGLRTHHVAIGGALLVAGALPVWTGADPSNIGLLLAGVAIALSGALDHRVFLHTFGPPHALDRGAGDVGA